MPLLLAFIVAFGVDAVVSEDGFVCDACVGACSVKWKKLNLFKLGIGMPKKKLEKASKRWITKKYRSIRPSGRNFLIRTKPHNRASVIPNPIIPALVLEKIKET